MDHLALVEGGGRGEEAWAPASLARGGVPYSLPCSKSRRRLGGSAQAFLVEEAGRGFIFQARGLPNPFQPIGRTPPPLPSAGFSILLR